MAKPGLKVETISPAPSDELRQIGAEIELHTPAASETRTDAVAGAPVEGPAGSPAPAPEAPAVDPSVMTPDAARDMALSVWNGTFDLVESAVPFLKFPPVTREKGADKLAPVILKHQHKMPEWFKRWREEIDLGIFVGNVVYQCTKAYFLAKRAAEQQAAKPQPSSETAPAAGAPEAPEQHPAA